MYQLTLSRAERAAIDWIGFRYWNGYSLRDILCHCFPQSAEVGWDCPLDITFRLPEYCAWDILELARQECGDYLICHCFSPELNVKIVDFLLRIV